MEPRLSDACVNGRAGMVGQGWEFILSRGEISLKLKDFNRIMTLEN